LFHSEEETSFKVIKTIGIQNCYIIHSNGQLRHSLERPGKPRIWFLSFFEKIHSSSDYIRPTFRQIVIDREVVISLQYKQIIAGLGPDL
jgi:hypothetical protein